MSIWPFTLINSTRKLRQSNEELKAKLSKQKMDTDLLIRNISRLKNELDDCKIPRDPKTGRFLKRKTAP